jgi:hypothetical protein
MNQCRIHPSSFRLHPCKRSRGPAVTTPGPHPGNDGSSPSGITVWAAGPIGRRRLRTPEMRVRFPRGPLEGTGSWSNGTTPVRQTGNPGSIPGGSSEWKVAGYGWPGRSANAVLLTEMRVRLPCLPLDAPMVKRTIIPRFERGVPGSNPGRGTSQSRRSAGRTFP